jgi:hypothetical protein
MTPITVWYRWTKQKDGSLTWEFNHIEDGHCLNDVPTPKHPSHEQVWKGKWQKEFAALDENNVVTK